MAVASPALAVDFTIADTDSPSAVLEAHGGYTAFSDSATGTENFWNYGGSARANFWLGKNASLQFDAWDEADDAAAFHTFPGVAAHLNWRNPDLGLLGGFASLGGRFGITYATGGIEGQAYFGNVTVYAQGSYQQSISGRFDIPAVSARTAVRVFGTPNLMLEGSVGYTYLFPRIRPGG